MLLETKKIFKEGRNGLYFNWVKYYRKLVNNKQGGKVKYWMCEKELEVIFRIKSFDCRKAIRVNRFKMGLKI